MESNDLKQRLNQKYHFLVHIWQNDAKPSLLFDMLRTNYLHYKIKLTIAIVFEAHVHCPFVNCAWFCICPHTAVTPPLLSEQMLLLRGHVTPDRPTVSHYDLLCCNMPLGGPTTSIHVMTRRPSMSKSAIAQSKQVSRPLGTMLDVNLPTRLLSSLLVVPLATWRLVSQKQPLWGMNINDRLHSKLASHPVLMFHICFSWKK